MSEREILLNEIKSIPDYQVSYLLGIVRGLNAEICNDATLEAFEEMQNGKYETFSGDTGDLFAEWDKEDA